MNGKGISSLTAVLSSPPGNKTLFAHTTIFIGMLTLGVALARPFYVIDAFFLAMLATLSVTILPQFFGQPLRTYRNLKPINLSLLVIAIMYNVVLLAYWFKSWTCTSLCWYTLHQKLTGEHSLTFIKREDYESLHSYAVQDFSTINFVDLPCCFWYTYINVCIEIVTFSPGQEW